MEEDGNKKQTQNRETIKIMGVIIDERLTWKHHIKQTKSKASRAIRNLARTSSILPLKSKKTLYDALVTPHLSYCDIVWDGTSKKWADNLQKTGNFAARSLLGLKKRESASSALSKLNMMTLDKKTKVHLGVMTHKLIQGKGPSGLV